MIVKRAYKYRIYPNKEQKVQLAQHFGCSRYVYNHYLRKRLDCYMLHKKGLTYQDNANDLVFLKKDLPWLAEVNSQTLQAALKDLEYAYTNFFKGTAKFPNFKKKNQKQSFRVPQHFKVNQNSITLPKVGKVKAKIHRPSGDRCYNITISKTSTGKYYASVVCDCYIPNPEFQGNIIGIDLGVKEYLVDSGGNRVVNPKWLQKLLSKLRRLQQILSNKTKESRNYLKLRLKIARLHEKIKNKRADFLHKLSLNLVRENQTICVETLGVKQMLDKSNHNLARNIQDSGCKVNKIDRYFPSTKRHYECGYLNEDLKLSDREWVCPQCKKAVDRDHNAALNILAAGTAVKSPLKREALPFREG